MNGNTTQSLRTENRPMDEPHGKTGCLRGTLLTFCPACVHGRVVDPREVSHLDHRDAHPNKKQVNVDRRQPLATPRSAVTVDDIRPDAGSTSDRSESIDRLQAPRGLLVCTCRSTGKRKKTAAPMTPETIVTMLTTTISILSLLTRSASRPKTGPRTIGPIWQLRDRQQRRPVRVGNGGRFLARHIGG